MSKKKPSKPKRRLISKAPAPPTTLRGGGYDQIRSKRPDWSFWNRLPALSIDECLMLLINVEPKGYLDSLKRQRYDRVCRLVQSFQSASKFPFDDTNVAPHEFIQWAKSIGEPIPEGWKPFCADAGHVETDLARETDSIHMSRYEEAVDAAILMLEEGTPPQDIVNDLIPRLLKDRVRFPNCCRRQIADKSLARSIRKGGGNPLEDLRYIAALKDRGK